MRKKPGSTAIVLIPYGSTSKRSDSIGPSRATFEAASAAQNSCPISPAVEVVEAVLRARPEVLLLDIETTGRSGLDVAEHLQRHDDPPKIIVLTTFKRPGCLRRALEAGARAYLTKDALVSNIAEAIRRVAGGDTLITGEQVSTAMHSGANSRTRRERDVLRASQACDTIAEVAAQLHLSVSTVSNYITDAIAKTQTGNRLQAIRAARENGWLQ